MKITAKDLKQFGIVNEIIKEPVDGAQSDFQRITKDIKKYLVKNIKELQELEIEELLEKRSLKYANLNIN